MITARQVYEKVVNIEYQEVDDFIEDVLIKKFHQSLGKSITVSEAAVGEYFEPHTFHGPKWLEGQLSLRGFDAKYVCEDRPCGSCNYEIAIPPQEE